jgi:hypothetical protein
MITATVFDIGGVLLQRSAGNVKRGPARLGVKV